MTEPEHTTPKAPKTFRTRGILALIHGIPEIINPFNFSESIDEFNTTLAALSGLSYRPNRTRTRDFQDHYKKDHPMATGKILRGKLEESAKLKGLTIEPIDRLFFWKGKRRDDESITKEIREELNRSIARIVHKYGKTLEVPDITAEVAEKMEQYLPRSKRKPTKRLPGDPCSPGDSAQR